MNQTVPEGQVSAFAKGQLRKIKDVLGSNPLSHGQKKEEEIESFTTQEILLLWNLYRMELLRFGTEGRITRSMFKDRFKDIGDEFLQEAILKVIDSDSNGIDFIEFVSLLRVITRGTEEEQTQLVFAFYDWDDRDGHLSYPEISKLVDSISWDIKSKVLREAGLATDRIVRDDFAPQSSRGTYQKSTSYANYNNVLRAPGDEVISQPGFKVVPALGPRRPDDFIVAGQAFRLEEERPLPQTMTVLSQDQSASMFSLQQVKTPALQRANDPINRESFHMAPKNDVDEDATSSDDEQVVEEGGEKNIDRQINELAGQNRRPYETIQFDATDDDDEDDLSPEQINQLRTERTTKLRHLLSEAFGGHDKIDYETFKRRSKMFPRNPIFSGVGLIDYFRDSFFGPLEKKVRRDTLTPPIMEGTLLKRNPGFFNSRDLRGRHHRVFVSIRSGFLFIFKKRPTQGQAMQPSRAIPLTNSKVHIRDEFKHGRLHWPHRLRRKKNRKAKKDNLNIAKKYSGQSDIEKEDRKYDYDVEDHMNSPRRNVYVAEDHPEDEENNDIFKFSNRAKKNQAREKNANPLFQEGEHRKIKKRELIDKGKEVNQGSAADQPTIIKDDSKEALDNPTKEMSDGNIVESSLVQGLARGTLTIPDDKGSGLLAGTWCFYLSAAKGKYKRYFLAAEQRERLEWMYAIIANSPYVPHNRYHSFASPKDDIACRWFVDATHYFSFVAYAMERAKKEIFIAGWWVCPHLQLIRGESVGDRYELKNILKRKADEGVVISVIAWNESVPMDLQSSYTKSCLEALSPNIRVMRHPHTVPIYWTHHQKIVVIDQDISFVGGLDLCYGRYDDSVHMCAEKDPSTTRWPGKDYFNESLKAAAGCDKPGDDIMDRSKEPRQPWHDIHMALDGEAARDVARVFVQRWNHHIVVLNSSSPHLYPKTAPPMHRLTEKGIHSGVKRSLLKKMISSLVSKDTSNDRGIMSSNPIQPLLNFIGCTVQNPVHQYAPDDSIDRSRSKPDLPHPDDPRKEPTTNLQPQDLRNSQGLNKYNEQEAAISADERARTNSLTRGPEITDEMDGEDHVGWHEWAASDSPLLPNSFSSKCQVQITRSMSPWSGALFTETSIHEAYLSLIENSEKFIYIENQYFISPIDGTGHNQIGLALYKRIHRAMKRNEKYRVVVLMPAFPTGGSWKNTMAVQYVMKWEYDTINRGGSSIMEKLRKKHPRAKITDYISFHCVRSVSHELEDLVSEQIYVHSKLLIVDDRVVVMGSANINDRSMKGDRDSEICAVVEDSEVMQGTMDGKPFEVRKFAHELRKRLWREHCGLDEGDNSIRDPLDDKVYHGIWLATATHNTDILDDVFDGIPKNSIHKLSQVTEEREQEKKKRHRFRRGKNEDVGESSSAEDQQDARDTVEVTQKADKEELEGISFGAAPKDDQKRKQSIDKLNRLKGHLCHFPLEFLKEESLTPGLTNPEAWVAVAIFQ